MLQENVNLKNYNTFGIDVMTQYFTSFQTEDELKELLSEHKDEKLLILGGGSNVLFLKDFDGIILLNRILGIKVINENNDSVIVEAGAGEIWNEFVLYTISQNWGGLENLSLIPGRVGASPMQNIGAYGVEIKDTFHSLQAINIKTGNKRVFTKEECKFGYRESVFKKDLKNQYVIISVQYKLSKNPKVNTQYGAIQDELDRRKIQSPTIKDVSNAVIAIRQSKLPDPKEIGNGGSFFKNPVIPIELFKKIQDKHPTVPSYPIDKSNIKVPAGWLIEQSGWKGKKIGACGVHNKQALVLVNHGGATGKDIYDLSSSIIADIQTKFGITLEREVNII
ncbi:MAG: UDP-N-acetylmuramate dehydrogenase [Brumimicrobium sp.]|nr:UDP-N-acetylmuramate dehydrogenase [Brumimicrobium sp.]